MNVRRVLRRYTARLAVIVPYALLLFGPTPAWPTSLLQSAQNFAVLGASGVTNTGPTTIKGDLGVFPGTSITNTGTLTITGSVHPADAPAEQGQSAAALAFGSLAALPFTTDLTGLDLGTLGVLSPGVYKFSSSAQLTGALVLDFGSHPDHPFVFQIGSTLTTASGSSVSALNGGADSGVYWDVGSSATLGTDTTFLGNILADQSITLATGADIQCGRAIALNGAVTMDSNTVVSDCPSADVDTASADFGSRGFSGPIEDSSAVPEPASVLLLTAGLIGAVVFRRSRTRVLKSS